MALVALLIVMILMVTMLLIAQFTAACGGKMSLFLFWLLFILGNLLKNTSRFVSHLTLLKESNELEQVRGHRLVQVRELDLIRLGLREEGLFTLLLRCGYFHRSTEAATLKIAEELYSMLHERVHQHESGLLGSTKPGNPLVAYIGETGNGLKVIPDAFNEVCLCTICVVGALLHDDVGPVDQAYV
jgi:hypothetical protein